MISTERFTIIDLIGEGGMGRVYKVFDSNLGKVCALKICKHPRSETERLTTIRESSIWFQFRHFGNVIEVYEILNFGHEGIGILMEYVERGSLRNHIIAGNLSMRDKVLTLYDVACALNNCRNILPGFCHLDIKPENCLRTNFGLTKLTDFGIASCNRVNLSHETFSMPISNPASSIYYRSKLGALCIGTPLYMSPEQISGADSVGEKSDIYALGLLALELFHGHHPLTETNITDIKFIFNAHLRGMLMENAKKVLPRIIDKKPDILVTCLAPDPAERPSLSDLISFLSSAFDGPSGYKNMSLPKLPAPVEEAVRTARSLWNIGQVTDAILFLNRSLEMDPFQAESWFLLAKWTWILNLQPLYAAEAFSIEEKRERIEKIEKYIFDVCTYALRAFVLDRKYANADTEDGLLAGILIPQSTYQVFNKTTEIDDNYNKWLQRSIEEQSCWIRNQEIRIGEVEGASRCLCIRCGEIKMYQIMRCPRCGFLPLEVEDMYLTNILHISHINKLNGEQKVPYWIRMQHLRQLGDDLSHNIDTIKSDPNFSRNLQLFAQEGGAKLLDLVHNGPSAQDMKNVRQFVRHIRRKKITNKIKSILGLNKS